ncbi:MAG TPA: DUF222 domain-containing protein, partial [Mycobacterium sp.]|nr:DUF222 domain-containing protein [Mycobacterium sp.]
MGSSAICDRESVVAAFDALDADVETVTALGFEALTTPERLRLLERLERVRRLLPVAEHELINQLRQQAAPVESGGSLAHALANRLRITRGEATRRINEAHDLGERRALAGEPLPPRLPATAAGQRAGEIGAGQISVIRRFFEQLPCGVDVAHPPVCRSAHADELRNSAPPDPAVTSDRVPLAEPSFWNPDDSVKRLRSCHVMAWTSGLGALTLTPPIQYLGHSGLRTTCLALLWGQIGIVGLTVAATTWTRLTGRGGKSADRLTKPMWWMQWVTVAVLVATLAAVAFTKPAHAGGFPPPPTPMPGLRDAINGLLSAEILLLVAFFLFTARCMHGWGRAVAATLRAFWWLLRPQRRDSVAAATGTPAGFAPSLDGLAAPFVATIGLLVAGGFSAGVGLWAAQLVGTPVHRAPRLHVRSGSGRRCW